MPNSLQNSEKLENEAKQIKSFDLVIKKEATEEENKQAELIRLNLIDGKQ